jgi:hypothetical protein
MYVGYRVLQGCGNIKNTREVHKEAQGVANCSSDFSSILKNFQVLIYRLFSLSHNKKKINQKPFGERSQENVIL